MTARKTKSKPGTGHVVVDDEAIIPISAPDAAILDHARTINRCSALHAGVNDAARVYHVTNRTEWEKFTKGPK